MLCRAEDRRDRNENHKERPRLEFATRIIKAIQLPRKASDREEWTPAGQPEEGGESFLFMKPAIS